MVGLQTSLPIVWRESADIAQQLGDGSDAPHWLLPVLEAAHAFVPLDALADAAGALPLPADAVLMLAQPRPLAPAENVALDRWVRGGGHVLLFADPMLTAHSRFALGDARRPQDVAMLSPILRHWGLELEFDPDQPEAEQVVEAGGVRIPVHLRGRWRLSGKAGDGRARCRIEGDSLIARCALGEGAIVAVADAALLEEPANPQDVARRREAFLQLLRFAVTPR